MLTQDLRVGFSRVGERGNDISPTSFSRHSLATHAREKFHHPTESTRTGGSIE
jgi:hypothetical protein